MWDDLVQAARGWVEPNHKQEIRDNLQATDSMRRAADSLDGASRSATTATDAANGLNGKSAIVLTANLPEGCGLKERCSAYQAWLEARKKQG